MERRRKEERKEGSQSHTLPSLYRTPHWPMSRRKQLNPRAMKEEGETNEKRMKGDERSPSRDQVSPLYQDEQHSTIKTESIEDNLIQCALCDGQFSSVALLQMHTITFHIPPPSSSLSSLVCPQCNVSLPSMATFALHMKGHLSEKTVPCPICGQIVREEEELMDHLAEHVIVQSVHLSCSECSLERGSDLSFREEAEFLVHSMDKHAKLQILCTICSNVFGDDFSYKMHSMTEHTQSRIVFHCTKCEKTIHSKMEMQLHLQSVHSSSLLSSENKQDKELRLLHCSVCDMECRGENALDEHRLYTHCKITQSDSCGECHLPISTQSQFMDHCERHSTDSHMSCVVCKQTLRNVAQLAVHAKFHSFEDVTPSDVDVVKEEKEEKSNGHTSPIPSLILPIPPPSVLYSKPISPSRSFRCPICGFRFNSQSRLDTHARKHLSSMSATCQICGDQFPKQDQLVMHMQSHKQNLTERARDGVFTNKV